jgi:hypothetical protein
MTTAARGTEDLRRNPGLRYGRKQPKSMSTLEERTPAAERLKRAQGCQ